MSALQPFCGQYCDTIAEQYLPGSVDVSNGALALVSFKRACCRKRLHVFIVVLACISHVMSSKSSLVLPSRTPFGPVYFSKALSPR